MEWTLDWRTGVWSTGFPFVVREFSFVVTELGPVQTPFHSCAEPNTFKFDFGATLERRLIQMAYLIRRTKLFTCGDEGEGGLGIGLNFTFEMVDEENNNGIQRLALVRAIMQANR